MRWRSNCANNRERTTRLPLTIFRRIPHRTGNQITNNHMKLSTLINIAVLGASLAALTSRADIVQVSDDSNVLLSGVYARKNLGEAPSMLISADQAGIYGIGYVKFDL